MATQNETPEPREPDDKLKLQALQRIAIEAFEELDRGDCVTVEPADLDKFLDEIAAQARARRPQ